MEQPKTACRLRIEDLETPGNPWQDCELWDGTPVLREPSGGWSGILAGRILTRLGQHVETRGLGWVTTGEQGFLVARDPDRMLAADVAYVSRSRLADPPRQGFWRVTPEFVVEVRSPKDSWAAVLAKCGVWIAHGAAVAWAVNPQAREVVALRPAVPPVEATGAQRLDAAPALPDFSMGVDEILAGY